MSQEYYIIVADFRRQVHMLDINYLFHVFIAKYCVTHLKLLEIIREDVLCIVYVYVYMYM